MEVECYFPNYNTVAEYLSTLENDYKLIGVNYSVNISIIEVLVANYLEGTIVSTTNTLEYKISVKYETR